MVEVLTGKCLAAAKGLVGDDLVLTGQGLAGGRLDVECLAPDSSQRCCRNRHGSGEVVRGENAQDGREEGNSDRWGVAGGKVAHPGWGDREKKDGKDEDPLATRLTDLLEQ